MHYIYTYTDSTNITPHFRTHVVPHSLMYTHNANSSKHKHAHTHTHTHTHTPATWRGVSYCERTTARSHTSTVKTILSAGDRWPKHTQHSHIHTHTLADTHTHTHRHTCRHTHTHAKTRCHKHTHAHTHTLTHTHTHTHTHTCGGPQSTHMSLSRDTCVC